MWVWDKTLPQPTKAMNAARAALIHELLHLKYANDEEKVRELTREYFAVFAQNRSARNSHIPSIYNMIFRPEAINNELDFLGRIEVMREISPQKCRSSLDCGPKQHKHHFLRYVREKC